MLSTFQVQVDSSGLGLRAVTLTHWFREGVDRVTCAAEVAARL